MILSKITSSDSDERESALFFIFKHQKLKEVEFEISERLE